MTSEAAFRYWLFALALCAVAVSFCIVYVDCPLALYLDAHVRHTEIWGWLNFTLRPFSLVVVVALFFLMACGIWLISGHQLRPWTATPFLCSSSAMAAVATVVSFKRIFGRGWPDPTFIRDHLYGFHLLRGEMHWDAFPSGTAAVSVAILAVLWVLKPQWRLLGLLVVIFLIAAVVITNYHWLSDVLAGSFLGMSIGWATVRLLYPCNRLTGEN
jgi:membrane-associated phospholipid phosphatase